MLSGFKILHLGKITVNIHFIYAPRGSILFNKILPRHPTLQREKGPLQYLPIAQARRSWSHLGESHLHLLQLSDILPIAGPELQIMLQVWSHQQLVS